MKQVRTHAFTTPSVGVWLWPHELAALAKLPAWFVALFVALVLRSNYRTGAGRTGYGDLINALQPDQPERGPRLASYSRTDIKRAMRRFEELQILAVDRFASEQAQTINFSVSDRNRRGVPARKLDREFVPGSTEVKSPKLDPGICTALSKESLKQPLTPQSGKLSTAEARAALKALADKMRGGAGGRTSAPKGAGK